MLGKQSWFNFWYDNSVGMTDNLAITSWAFNRPSALAFLWYAESKSASKYTDSVHSPVTQWTLTNDTISSRVSTMPQMYKWRMWIYRYLRRALINGTSDIFGLTGSTGITGISGSCGRGSVTLCRKNCTDITVNSCCANCLPKCFFFWTQSFLFH